MPLRLTLDAFSGRPNPTVMLDGHEADELLERLAPEKRLTGKQAPGVPPDILGYRGIEIELVDHPHERLPSTFRVAGGLLSGRKLRHAPADPFVEDFVCGSTGPFRLANLRPDLLELIRQHARELREIDWRRPPIDLPRVMPCPCGPIYEPQWWNDGGQRQLNNNCYNYATNYRTDTFAQPGRASGQIYPLPISCAGVRPAAVRDDLIDSPRADNQCPPQGHLVALVVAPGYDFHWYRKGADGMWTHKPGSTQVTNVDQSGNPIADPRTANRGPYTDFCTFMIVMHGHVKIR